MANPSRRPEIPINLYSPRRERVHAVLEVSAFAVIAGTVFAVALALVLFITTAGHAELLPIPWFAACPPGYYSNGGFCALPIPRFAACPPGYYPNGGFCIPSSRDTREAIVLSAAMNVAAFTAQANGWLVYPGVLFGLAIPGLIYLTTRIAAAIYIDCHARG
jgi:hypothetical protein